LDTRKQSRLAIVHLSNSVLRPRLGCRRLVHQPLAFSAFNGGIPAGGALQLPAIPSEAEFIAITM
jgi:hypothetical protein